MQVHNVSAGYSDPAALSQRGKTVEATENRPSAGLEAVTSSGSSQSTALGEILSHYDVTEITPAGFSEMVQRLYEAGAISEQEFQQLAAIRLDLNAEGIDPDESIDLLEFYVRKLERLQRRFEDSDGPEAGHEQLGPLLGRLDWIEKFALVQAAPDTTGLDALV